MNEDQKKVLEELYRLESESSERLVAGDIDWIFDTIVSPDIVQMSPGFPAQNKKEYEAWFRSMVSTEGLEFTYGPHGGGVSESLDMGYVYGWTKLTIPGQGTQNGKYTSIWTKHGEEWKCVIEINNFTD